MGKRLARTHLLLLLAGLLLALLWAFETDKLPGRAADGPVSCREYTKNINSLYKIIPRDTPAEERCRLTPPRCGPTGLIFNPAGMQSYYYRSQCYHELAIASLDEAHCSAVVERRSLIFDGSHYSQQACLTTLRQIRADRAAPRVEPGAVARIDTLTAAFDQEQHFSVTLTLSPETPVYGTYAIATTAHLDMDSPGAATGTAVTVALNASHPAIRRDRRYARLLPIGDELLQLTAELGQPASLTYRADTGQLVAYLKRSTRRDFALRVRLQFLESTTGALAEPDIHRGAYISEKVMQFTTQQAARR
jgi:hypothetical protein